MEGRWTRKESIVVWKQIDEFILEGKEPTLPVLRRMKQKNPEEFTRIVLNRRLLREEAKSFVPGVDPGEVSRAWKPEESSQLYRMIMRKPKMARKLLKKILTEKIREQLGDKYDEVMKKNEFLPEPDKGGPVRESKWGRYWTERLMRVANYKMDLFRAEEFSRLKKKEKPKGE